MLSSHIWQGSASLERVENIPIIQKVLLDAADLENKTSISINTTSKLLCSVFPLVVIYIENHEKREDLTFFPIKYMAKGIRK